MAFPAPLTGLPAALGNGLNGLSAPIQLVPLTSLTGGLPGAVADDGATSVSVSSFGLLPFLLSSPLGWMTLLIFIFLIRNTLLVVLPVIAPGLARRLFGVKKPSTERPYYNAPAYHDDYEDYGKPYAGGMAGKRRKRETNKIDSAVPVLTVGEVENLTRIVFAAVESQECMQRLICEAGSVSKSYSDTALSVARAVADFVPNSLKDSYEIFAKAENCEKYSCGDVKIPKPADFS